MSDAESAQFPKFWHCLGMDKARITNDQMDELFSFVHLIEVMDAIQALATKHWRRLSTQYYYRLTSTGTASARCL